MKAHKNGFTIVEMIIVVVVIAVLAMITVFYFNNYRARTARTEMKNELMQGASAVKNYRNFNNAYPLNQASFNTVYKIGNEVTLTYVADNPAGSNFCLKATSVNDTSVWYISSVTTQPAASAPTVPAVTCP